MLTRNRRVLALAFAVVCGVFSGACTAFAVDSDDLFRSIQYAVLAALHATVSALHVWIYARIGEV